MRKLRISIITLSCFLAALIAASWWKKDIVASQLINIFSGEVVIQELTGLRLGFKEVSIQEVRLKSSVNSIILLEGVKIVYPFHIIYDRDNTQKIELSIEKLTRSMEAEDIVTKAHINEQLPENNVKTSNTLSLSALSQSLTRFLPGKISVKQIVLDGQLIGGPLNIARDSTKIHAETPLKHPQFGELNLYFEAFLGLSEIKLKPRILTNNSMILSEADITIAKLETDTWILNSELVSELESIAPLIEIFEPKASSTTKPTVSGKIIATTAISLPDNLLSISSYREIDIQLNGNDLKATIPYAQLNSNIEAQLSISNPIKITLESLFPFKPRHIKGSGELDIALGTDKNTNTPLLSADFSSSTSATSPELDIEGTFHLTSANTIVNSPLYLRHLPTLPIDSVNGDVAFKGKLQLSSLNNINSPEVNSFQLELIPNQTIQLDISAPTSGKNSPLISTGLHQSKIQASIKDLISITGDLTNPNKRDIKVEQGSLTATIQGSNGDSTVQLTASGIQCHFSDISACNFELKTKVPQLYERARELAVTNLSSTAKAKIESNLKGQNFTLESIKVSGEKIATKTFAADRVNLDIPRVHCEVTEPTICTLPEISSQFGIINTEQFSLSGDLNFLDSIVTIKNGAAALDSEFNSINLEIETSEKYKVNPSAKGKLSLQHNKLTSHSQIKAGAIKIDLSGSYDLSKSSGGVEFSVPEVIFSTDRSLNDTIQGLPLNIVSGRLSAGGSVSFPSQSKDSIHVSLDDIAATYKDSFAIGISGDLKVENEDGHWITPTPYPLSIESINAGLPVKNVQLSLQLDKQKDITLHNFSADFLQGRVTSSALIWNLAEETRKSIVHAQGISLEALAQETDSENFEASGLINLEIPIVTGPEGITVEAGHLQGEAPGGRLRYYGAFSPQMLASNPQLKLIANALEDYEFQSLEGSIDYPASGDLQLQLKLVGRSEAIDSDRDLVINLNLENNIPDMLRSLQASRDLTETLEKQLDQ
ncbi:intermembrane phospholipid transport protein YdbH family protein [Microbulbifer sp. JTAC008]|uniref:intermembrane phospholipid transport protein YdbH family protein n=1 Tax=unclassified Microbulbifer TaxID=2619833 RepID=UPI0040397605